MAAILDPPSATELKSTLKSALPVWQALIQGAETRCVPLLQVWKPSKTGFDRMCLLQHRKRTILYLTPDVDAIWVAVILGERAYQIALGSSLSARIKDLFTQAKPYVEGRGIRFSVTSAEDLAEVFELIRIKMTP